MLRTCLSLLLILAAAPANLFTNGDFEQPLDIGWKQSSNNLAGLFSFDRWDTMGQPTPGFAARVYKTLAYYACLAQDVSVPGADLAFSIDARLRIGGGSSTCWPTCAVVLSYVDAADAELGSTMILLRSEYCTWVESDTLHFIDVTAPGAWVTYNIDVADEIAQYLPGVNPAEVAKLRVELYSYDSGT